MAPSTVRIGDRTIKVTNLDKVMYPVTGTTKGDVIAYYAAVADWFVPHSAGRPATRKRWVNGVGTEQKPGHEFFNKNLDPKSTPPWVRTHTIEHAADTNTYPLIDEPATLVWLAQLASLEIHLPQWRVNADDFAQHPDRLVLDLDPGEGAGMAQCVELAFVIREVLDAMGLRSVPVTSGSKGLHLYTRLDGTLSSDEVTALAHELAMQLEALHPKLVVSNMKKDLRGGKVLLDWSQNSASKTTIAPYSLRGRFRPTVAVPRTWDELGPDLVNLELDQVTERLAAVGDPLAALLDDRPSGAGRPGTDRPGPSQSNPEEESGRDRLSTYRSMRDADRTPEPVPTAAPTPGAGNTFVIQEHHARRLHYDFRLEHDGVLVSWAVPKGPPLTSEKNHLAVQTEDHPLEYATFAGEIPKGEYGGGNVSIWDAGSYKLEKWIDGKEVIATLTGRPDGGLGGVPRRYALIHTKLGGEQKNWLIHLMAGPAGGRSGDAGKGGTSDAGPAASGAVTSAANGPVPTDGNELSGVDTPGADKLGPATAVATSPIPTCGNELSGVNTPNPPAPRPPTPISAAPSARPDLPIIEPMLASPAVAADLTGDDWHYEIKWDGYRAIAAVADGRLIYRSRRGLDFTGSYPELAELTALVGDHAVVLDGEIVALDEQGRARFELLQNHGSGRTAAHYMAFDLLHLDGRSLLRVPYLERRGLLEDLLGEGGRYIHVPTTFGPDRETALDTSRELGLEGVVAKRPSSIYQPGRRAHTWLKVKHRHIQDVVIVGWKPSEANRYRGIGSLLMAVNDDAGLRYVGRVGSGFTQQGLDEAQQVLETIPSDEPPLDGVPAADAKDARWVEPLLVGQVEYGEWTDTDRLRHPVWRGWRPEVRAEDVGREL